MYLYSESLLPYWCNISILSCLKTIFLVPINIVTSHILITFLWCIFNKWINKEVNEFRFWIRCHLLFSHTYKSPKSDDFSMKLHWHGRVVHKPISLAFKTVVWIGGGLSSLKTIKRNGHKCPNNPAPFAILQLHFYSIIFLSYFFIFSGISNHQPILA